MHLGTNSSHLKDKNFTNQEIVKTEKSLMNHKMIASTKRARNKKSWY